MDSLKIAITFSLWFCANQKSTKVKAAWNTAPQNKQINPNKQTKQNNNKKTTQKTKPTYKQTKTLHNIALHGTLKRCSNYCVVFQRLRNTLKQLLYGGYESLANSLACGDKAEDFDSVSALSGGVRHGMLPSSQTHGV